MSLVGLMYYISLENMEIENTCPLLSLEDLFVLLFTHWICKNWLSLNLLNIAVSAMGLCVKK